MSLDDIIKTRKGNYRVINVVPQGSGTMISIRKTNGNWITEEKEIGGYEIFQVYNHSEKPEVLAFTDAVWLKPYIARYMSKRNLNQVLLKK